MKALYILKNLDLLYNKERKGEKKKKVSQAETGISEKLKANKCVPIRSKMASRFVLKTSAQYCIVDSSQCNKAGQRSERRTDWKGRLYK